MACWHGSLTPRRRSGGRVAGFFGRVAGLLLIAVPFLPLRSIFGEMDGASLLIPPGEWLLGIAICAALAWLSVPLIEATRRAGSKPPRRPSSSRAVVLSLSVVLLVALIAISRLVFHGRPHLVDSIAQLFQARIFANGALTAAAPPLAA